MPVPPDSPSSPPRSSSSASASASSAPPRPGPARGDGTTRLPRWVVFLGIAIVLVFIAAMVAQYVQVRTVRGDLRAARAELAMARSEASLGAAAAEAQQGRYEPARVLASRFFTGLQQRVTDAAPDRRAALQAILDRRDATITLLSRQDPASVPLLAGLVTDYRTALHGESPPE